jgi:hypothetical protein
MFQAITLRGGRASLLWGHQAAIVVRSWRIRKQTEDPRWVLVAAIERVDGYASRKRPLLFTAPRVGGFWCWPVEALEVGTSQLRAVLGPPEQ